MLDRLERDSVRFAFEVRDAGPWLILLHGLGGDRTQVLDLVGEVGWHRLAIDLRAHGETEPVGPPESLCFAVLADDVAGILDELGIETAVIAGVSMGAGVAARFALDRPGRVDGLVCVRPAWLDEPLPENLLVFPQIADLLRSEGPERGLAAFLGSAACARIQAASGPAGTSLGDQFLQPLAVERADRLERMPASVPFDDIEDLRGVRVPSLVIGCEQDPIHPMAFAYEWASRLERSVRVDVTSKTREPATYQREVREATAVFLREVIGDP